MYSGLWVALFCCHVTYLSVFKFDYGYNMTACVAAGMLGWWTTVPWPNFPIDLCMWVFSLQCRCLVQYSVGDLVFKGDSLQVPTTLYPVMLRLHMCHLQNKDRWYYTWKCAATVTAASCFVLLEVSCLSPHTPHPPTPPTPPTPHTPHSPHTPPTYVHWCVITLQLLDFPPFWWTFDAHSLWHLSTVPLPLMWYR
jgi:hypothetical protein